MTGHTGGCVRLVVRVRNRIGRIMYRIGFPSQAGWWDAGTDAFAYRSWRKSQQSGRTV